MTETQSKAQRRDNCVDVKISSIIGMRYEHVALTIKWLIENDERLL